jgi:hypothetical protein
MLIRRFEVQGFKNLTEPLVLEDLGPLNVLHGDNNVGKSNILKAMDLFFRLLAIGHSPVHEPFLLDDHKFFQLLDQKRVEVFNLASPVPIVLSAHLEVEPGDWKAAGVPERQTNELILVEHRLTWVGSRVEYSVTNLRADIDISEAMQLLLLLSGMYMPRQRSFQRIKAKRTDEKSSTELAEKLYNAKEAGDLPTAQRWERFGAAMAEFGDLLGVGRFWPRHPSNQPYQLDFRTESALIPVHLLGSGIQQLVAILAEILVSGTSIVAVEEPELHLKVNQQERLRDILRKLPGTTGAPSQIFLTSHSPFFEVSDSFYFISRSATGAPMVTRRPASEAALAVGAHAPTTIPKLAGTSWVSHDGVHRLTAEVMEHLGIVGGGSVFAHLGDERGIASIESDAHFLTRLGLDEEEA